MTKWGVGPLLAAIWVPAGVASVVPRAYWPEAFSFDLPVYWQQAVPACALVVGGLFLHVSAARAVLPAFQEKRLVTTGAYALCRHPLYASFVFFYFPGSALLLDAWPGLGFCILAYTTARLLSRREERYCEDLFGEEYHAYRRRTPALAPVGLLMRRGTG
jgi:protein-S-isoprenylcysteine O-methyltransferase Ste14